MKKAINTVFLLVTAILPNIASAQEISKPFQLPAGIYSYECSSMYAESIDGEIMSGGGYEKGRTQVSVNGPVVVELSQSESEYAPSNSIRKIVTTELGNGRFKQEIEGSGVRTANGELLQNSFKAEVIVEAVFTTTRNITVKVNNQDERPGYGETFWEVLKDGRILVQKYIREKFQTKIEGSDKVREILISNSSCFYRKLRN